MKDIRFYCNLFNISDAIISSDPVFYSDFILNKICMLELRPGGSAELMFGHVTIKGYIDSLRFEVESYVQCVCDSYVGSEVL